MKQLEERERDERDSGLISLPHISITPSFLGEFLRRIGASHEDPEAAVEAIERSDFNASEMEAIRGAVAPFEELYVAVRSDESTAAGVGLWHTGFLLVDNSSSTAQQAAEIAKVILASDFSQDVLAFKRRVGLPLEENPGLLVMPVAGYNVGTMPPIYATPYHANVITGFTGDDDLVAIGIGMGGANNRGSFTTLLSRLSPFHFGTQNMDISLARSSFLYEGELRRLLEIEDGEQHVRINLDGLVAGGGAAIQIDELRDAIAAIKAASETPLYLEFGLEAIRWSVLQCAEVKLKDVEKPDVPGSQKILTVDSGDRGSYGRAGVAQFSNRVSGRRIVEADKVVKLDTERGRKISRVAEVNEELRDYVLIIDAPLSILSTALTFADYSNAVAIISMDEALGNAGSHFNGALREAGIVVLVGYVNGEFLEDLESGKPVNRKLLVYANDAKEEGFVATRD